MTTIRERFERWYYRHWSGAEGEPEKWALWLAYKAGRRGRRK